MYWFAGRDPALKDSPQILSRVEVWTLESPFHNLHVSSFIHSTTNFDACLESLSCWNTSYVQVSTVAVETWTQLSVSTGQWSLLELKNLSIIVINQKSLGLGFVKLKYIVEHWEPLIKRFNRVDLSWYVENFSLKKNHKIQKLPWHLCSWWMHANFWPQKWWMWQFNESQTWVLQLDVFIALILLTVCMIYMFEIETMCFSHFQKNKEVLYHVFFLLI